MILPISVLLIGVVFGRFFLSGEVDLDLDFAITAMLCVVVFCAGIDVGCKKSVLQKLREYKAKVLIVPVGTIIGSVAGGLVAGAILGMPAHESAAISAGFGYYSMAVGIFNELNASHLAALVFLSNNLREIFALIVIPVIAKYIHPLSAVAAGGATTMDVTLPVISRCTNEEITIIAMINGVILTALVPVLVPLLWQLF